VKKAERARSAIWSRRGPSRLLTLRSKKAVRPPACPPIPISRP